MTQEAPKKKRRWYSRLLPSTLEGRVSFVVGLLLVVTVLIVWIVRWAHPDNVAFRHIMTWGRLLTEFGLAIIIPIALYWGIRWWSRVEREEFPDIDRAWKAGLDALHVNGISVDTLPVFLVLGSPSPGFENNLMASSLSDARILGVPPETTVRHALRWYASERAIYLFCTNTCALSDLAQTWNSQVPQPQVRPQTPPLIQTPVQSVAKVAEAPSHTAGGTVRQEPADAGTYDGTIQPEDAISPYEDSVYPSGIVPPRPQTVPVEPPSTPSDPYVGTLGAEDFNTPVPPAAYHQPVTPSGPPAPAPQTTDTLASLPTVDPSQHVRRLQYVCQLLRHRRGPRCGANGLLTLLPFQLAQARNRDLENLAGVTRKDVEVIQETLGLRIPVTSLVVGLERAVGFAEFISRLGPKYRSRRLGGRFELSSRPTPEKLNTHSDRICDAFEDWIYQIFGQPDAHKLHRGNRKLYWLLSRIRHELKPRLRMVLGRAFGCETAKPGSGEDDSMLFSGCYFGAVCPTAQDSAFLRGVIDDKLLREQSQVEWNADSRFRERIFRWITVVAWAIFVILFALLIYRFLP